MIITRIISGLGNQLFQYAAGYALAARHGVPLRLDLRFFDGQSLRTYELHRFNISARPMTRLDRLRISLGVQPSPREWSRRLARRLPVRPLVPWREPLLGPAGQPVVSAPDFTALFGYWQSEDHFVDAADGLRRELTFHDPPDPANAAVLDQIGRSPHPVCVHVRRGDYTKGQEVVTTCPPQYYVDALALMRQRVPGGRLFVFSDDPGWTRANLPVPPTATFVTHNVGVNDPEDLRLMAACRHFIIANSTFSWWAAWLSSAPPADGLVIAPRRWFAVAHGGEQRIVPQRWVRL